MSKMFSEEIEYIGDISGVFKKSVKKLMERGYGISDKRSVNAHYIEIDFPCGWFTYGEKAKVEFEPIKENTMVRVESNSKLGTEIAAKKTNREHVKNIVSDLDEILKRA